MCEFDFGEFCAGVCGGDGLYSENFFDTLKRNISQEGGFKSSSRLNFQGNMN